MTKEMQATQRAYMVKQYVAQVQTRTGQVFRVFTTGHPSFYLFDPLDKKDGCSGCTAFPVRRTDLRRDIASMLARGCGNA